jgi:eukaryotic-like serine/threonine-protein kinase
MAVDAHGLCPACLLRIGLSEQTNSVETTAGDGQPRFDPKGPLPRGGDDFGEYRLIRLLGRGGFGLVWEAEHRVTDRRVALKVVTEVSADSPEALARFQREGQIAASLNDPHCVYVYGAEVIDGYPTIVMELMRGGTLQDVLDTRRHLPPAEAVDRLLDAIDGLEAAYRAGVLHRDIKPSNCFVDETGAVKIGDFGISTTLAQSQLTQTGSFVGTPVYASPEQARGRDVDIRSDIYSLGATMYTLLSGRPPFAGNNPGEVLARVLGEKPSPIGRHRITLPNGLERVVDRMLAKDPAKRYQDYSALRAALLPFSSSALNVASLAERFCAYAVDTFLVTLIFDLPASVLWPRAVAGGDASMLDPLVDPRFYYFLFAEGQWGRTVGKHLFGLRVATTTGVPSSWPHVIVRTAIFFFLPTLFRIVLEWLIQGSSFVGFLGGVVLDVLPLFVSMRASNGYAGLHELLSGTRVMASHDKTMAMVPNFQPTVAVDRQDGLSSFGPYRVLGTLRQTPTQSVMVARDDVLQRNVWIHQFTDATTMRPMSTLAVSRATRLRWLNGSRASGHDWDAYEAPPGTSLHDWVNQSGRLSWNDARRVLLDVALEIQALAAEDDATSVPVLSLERVWVDAGGRARLLGFVVAQTVGTETDEVPIDQWRVFIHSLVFFMLEGVIRSKDARSIQTPQAPIPEYVRPLLGEICRHSFRSIDDLVAAVRRIAERPAYVTRGRRVGPLLAAPTLTPLAITTIVWISNGLRPEAQSPLGIGVILLCAVPMIAIAVALRGCAWLRAFGIAVQTSQGRPAGRWRCGLRALVVWLPLLVLLRVAVFNFAVIPHRITYGFSLASQTWMMTLVFWGAIASLVGGALYALMRPHRGLPDLLSGTHLMPM